jgi:hypothetical protein
MITSPMKAIRQNCIECAGGSPTEVSLCPCTNCPMYAFRFGKNPYRKKRVMTDEQREASIKRLAEARAKRG